MFAYRFLFGLFVKEWRTIYSWVNDVLNARHAHSKHCTICVWQIFLPSHSSHSAIPISSTFTL